PTPSISSSLPTPGACRSNGPGATAERPPARPAPVGREAEPLSRRRSAARPNRSAVDGRAADLGEGESPRRHRRRPEGPGGGPPPGVEIVDPPRAPVVHGGQ